MSLILYFIAKKILILLLVTRYFRIIILYIYGLILLLIGALLSDCIMILGHRITSYLIDFWVLTSFELLVLRLYLNDLLAAMKLRCKFVSIGWPGRTVVAPTIAVSFVTGKSLLALESLDHLFGREARRQVLLRLAVFHQLL